LVVGRAEGRRQEAEGRKQQRKHRKKRLNSKLEIL
jgi:hypothetical protein